MWDAADLRTRIKLCEFESLDAAWPASQLGADALGFHLFRGQSLSQRVTRFREIFRWLPPQINKVLLTDLDLDWLRCVLTHLSVDTVQLYPDWPADAVARVRDFPSRPAILKVVSALPQENCVADYRDFFARYDDVVDGYLLDSARAGGTGRPANWTHCAAVVRQTPRLVFLAGGLTAENVAQAIRAVRPFGVDVETGVSNRIPGGPLVKDLTLCKKFVESVRISEKIPRS
jgi:phosphoribosylanthranilate isomerase